MRSVNQINPLLLQVVLGLSSQQQVADEDRLGLTVPVDPWSKYPSQGLVLYFNAKMLSTSRKSHQALVQFRRHEQSSSSPWHCHWENPSRLRGSEMLTFHPERGRKTTKEGSHPKWILLSSTWFLLNVKVQGYENKHFASCVCEFRDEDISPCLEDMLR